MVKLVALYSPPPESADFARHFDTVHLPLLRTVRGLQSLEVTRITGAAFGESRFTYMVELLFATRDAADAALASREGKAVARDLLAFAGPHVTLFQGETEALSVEPSM
jgi:uncharacterized protein (TIGR02118 family)